MSGAGQMGQIMTFGLGAKWSVFVKGLSKHSGVGTWFNVQFKYQNLPTC